MPKEKTIWCQGKPFKLPSKAQNVSCYAPLPATERKPRAKGVEVEARHMALARQWWAYSLENPAYKPNGLGPMGQLSEKEAIRETQLKAYARAIATWESRWNAPFTLSFNNGGQAVE